MKKNLCELYGDGKTYRLTVADDGIRCPGCFYQRLYEACRRNGRKLYATRNINEGWIEFVIQ